MFGEDKLEKSVSVRAILELIGWETRKAIEFANKFRPHFAYKWPDNVSAYVTKILSNIPCGSRDMSIILTENCWSN